MYNCWMNTLISLQTQFTIINLHLKIILACCINIVNRSSWFSAVTIISSYGVTSLTYSFVLLFLDHRRFCTMLSLPVFLCHDPMTWWHYVLLAIYAAHCRFKDLILWVTYVISTFCLIHSNAFRFLLVLYPSFTSVCTDL